MICPRCHGKGYVYSDRYEGRFVVRHKKPCDYRGCHAGQVSCSEGSERTGGVEDAHTPVVEG